MEAQNEPRPVIDPRLAPAELWRQVPKLLADTDRFGSDSQRRLLDYLAQRKIESPETSLREHQIATEALGRPADFDPRADAIVRAQIGRLRGKLQEYYGTAGKEDPVIIDLPKGSYSLVFRARPSEVEAAAAEVAPPQESRKSRTLVYAMAGLAAVSILANVWLAARSGATSRPAVAASVETLWNHFLTARQAPVLVFSNAAFTGDPLSGLRHFDATMDRDSAMLNHYTGVGEVLGTLQIGRLFSAAGKDLRVKRGRLLTLDDARLYDLIFIGSRGENLALRDMPAPSEFHLSFKRDNGKLSTVTIENLHPQAGEPKEFLVPLTPPIQQDYATIALLHGIDPARRILILAGATTLGTQSAAEFVCDPKHAAELLARLAKAGIAPGEPFEAILRVPIRSGVPLNSELVTVHAEAKR